MVQAHPSEEHSISLSTQHNPADSAHQAWVLANGGAVLSHVVLPLKEVLQPLHGASSRLPGLLSFSQEQELGKDGHLTANPGLSQGAGIPSAAGAGQAAEEVGTTQRCGGRVVGPGEHVRVDGVDPDVLSGLQQELQTGFTVRRKDEGLNAPTLPLDPNSREVREHQSLEGGEGGLQWRESRRSPRRDRNWALRSHTGAILSNGQLGDLTFTSAVIQDEERQAGVAEEAPGLRRLQLPGQRQEGRVLEPTEVQDQRGQGGQERKHVVTPRTAGGKTGRKKRSITFNVCLSKALVNHLQYPTKYIGAQ